MNQKMFVVVVARSPRCSSSSGALGILRPAKLLRRTGAVRALQRATSSTTSALPARHRRRAGGVPLEAHRRALRGARGGRRRRRLPHGRPLHRPRSRRQGHGRVRVRAADSVDGGGRGDAAQGRANLAAAEKLGGSSRQSGPPPNPSPALGRGEFRNPGLGLAPTSSG